LAVFLCIQGIPVQVAGALSGGFGVEIAAKTGD
jgi:hypothetical protein